MKLKRGASAALSLLPLVACLLYAPALSAQQEPRASALYREGEYHDAILASLDDLERSPRDMNAYTVLGLSLLKLARYQEAVDYELKAFALAPHDSRIIEILGEGYYFLGNDSKALEYFQSYAAFAPAGNRIDDTYYYMGEIFIRMKEYNRADIAISTAVHFSADIAQWWSRLGYAREMANNPKLALQAHDRALELNPQLQDALRGKARVKAALGQ